MNRGKRSMTLNLKSAEGVSVLKRLLRDYDVLVESFRPGVMDRLGCGFAALSNVNPRLVYCAITGYGQDGPYAQRAGHDINYLGYAGVLDIIGESPDRPPVDPGVQIADIGGGASMAAIGILAAVAERARTGRGRFVDISMMDGAMSWLSIHAAAYAMTGITPRRGVMRLSGEFACYHVYRCGDGKWATLGALEPQFWVVFCNAVGLEDLIEKQFDVDAQPEMIARVSQTLSSRTRDEWCALLERLDACFGPVNDMREAFDDPQVRARNMVIDVPLPNGPVPEIGNPLRFGDVDAGPARPAPGFGEHTDLVLREAGYSGDDIAGLRARGVI
ncbi:MAG: CoA transferase [Actinobacteria bacterium]|nr:CoA transferase [Actinomycetota bacterium]